jgi:hypothetical protein
VFEAFKLNFPDSIITIEQMLLLVAALSSHEEIDFTRCSACGHFAIVDRLKVMPHHCESCGGALLIEQKSNHSHAELPDVWGAQRGGDSS